MQIILLSGGSGTRLWPLSNDARSKQFLRLLPINGCDKKESMVQRVLRQIKESKLKAEVTVATSESQKDSIISQLGEKVNLVLEPSRRDTFPAIALACEFLFKEKNCSRDEIIIVMPCDPYTEIEYFSVIKQMAQCVESKLADLVLMGIKPSYPSTKYGYMVPGVSIGDGVAFKVKQFTEKPSETIAKQLILEGALWNGGVFAFCLGYMIDIAKRYVDFSQFEDIRSHYNNFNKISFDYEVVENAKSVAVVPFEGEWKDLGTWNSLAEVLPENSYGKVITDNTGKRTHIINELEIPILCIGTHDLIIAASPDGILISEKSLSENIKTYANQLKQRPMYEERRWGIYKVIDYVQFPDGYSSLTKQLTLNAGCSISYQEHLCRDEVWTIIDGSGEIVLNGERRLIKRGETIHIARGVKHALRADTQLSFIEVQSGSNLVETDILRYPFEW